MGSTSSIEKAENELREKGVPRDQWIYISANANYTDTTPLSNRLGLFTCDRKFILTDIQKYPHLFTTVVDGSNIDNVLFYVGATTYFEESDISISRKGEDLRKLVQDEVENHQNKKCSCFSE